jgi:signal peptidase I
MRTDGVVREVIIFILLAVVIVLPIRFFVAQPFVVQGESMHPTFENGDYLIVDELSYDFSAPKRGDVIVFRYPGDPSIFYIKRIIGLPGETVSINKGVVDIKRVDGSDLALTSEPYISAEDATYTLSTSLGAGEYFVMGDNRPNSSDSRVWGSLPAKDIMGRVFLRLLPASTASVFPGLAHDPQ